MLENQTIQIEVSNHSSRILSELPTDLNIKIDKALSYLDLELSYQSKSDPTINPYGYCYNLETQSFLTGLLDRVIKEIEDYGFNVKLINKLTGQLAEEINYDLYPYNCLRYYQLNAIKKSLEWKRATIKLPTRSGKSPTIAGLAKALPGHGFITVPSKELLYQLYKELIQWCGETPGIIGDGNFETSRINIATPVSLLNRIKEFSEFREFVNQANWLITDECHLTAADSYLELGKHISNRIYSIGFSATLYREDGKDLLLEAVNGPLVYSVSSEELIENKPNYLTKPKIVMINCPIRHKRPFANRENPLYRIVYKSAITDNKYRNNLIIDHALEACKLGMSPVLILVKQIPHGKKLQELFKDRGHKVKFISSDSSDRAHAVKEISLGKTEILISSKILTTGVNIKPLRTLIYAAAGRSRISTIQAAGRPLTLFDGKDEAWVIDYYDIEPVYINRHADIRYSAYKEEYGKYTKHIKDHNLTLEEIFYG